MAFGRPLDPKMAQAIAKDVAEMDSKPTMKLCDCTGGPRNKEGRPGTGLVDDYTLCPKCKGTGRVKT